MDDPRTIKVLGFAGSLRKGSYNRMALRAAEELLPDGMTLAIFDITPIPLYNEDRTAPRARRSQGDAPDGGYAWVPANPRPTRR